MTRDNARELAVQIVFGAAKAHADAAEFCESFFSEEHYGSLKEENEVYSELPKEADMAYIRDVVGGTFAHLDEIDAKIAASTRGWTLSRISGTALAVMRVAVYEIFYRDDVPAASAINSAVEIDKGYDEADTVAFVNGVLGGVLRSDAAEAETKEDAPAAAE